MIDICPIVPIKVLVKKDEIYIKCVHGQDLISRAKPGRSPSILYDLVHSWFDVVYVCTETPVSEFHLLFEGE